MKATLIYLDPVDKRVVHRIFEGPYVSITTELNHILCVTSGEPSFYIHPNYVIIFEYEA